MHPVPQHSTSYLRIRHALLWVALPLIALAVNGCGEKAGRTVTFLHLADTHAQLETHPEYMPGATPDVVQMGGYARIKTLLDRLAHAAPGAVFAVDCGDTIQGSGPAAWSQGEVLIAPFNELGLDLEVPGNWEVVYGVERFRTLMAKERAPVICYNFHDKKTDARLFPPSLTLERQGVKVLVVGLTDPTTTERQPPAEVKGLDSTRMSGLDDFLRARIAADHPDLVVAATHTGLTVSRQIAREHPLLDIILSGHTHERTGKPIHEGRTLIVEPGSMGSFVGRLTVTLAPTGGIASSDFALVPVTADIPEDPVVKAAVDRNLAPFRARQRRVVGRAVVPIMRYDVLETNADDWIADVVREQAGSDLGITNGFRYSPPILAGDLTEGNLWDLLPLDARMKMGWVTGAELESYLEDELELVFSKDAWHLSGGWGPRLSGLVMTFAAKEGKGHRLRTVLIAGTPLETTRHYTIAGCEREGEPLDVVCRLRGVHDVAYLPETIHEALLSFLVTHPVIAPKRDGRARAVDLPDHVFSQDHVLSGDDD